VVFSSGKSTRKINNSYINAYESLFKKEPSYYPMAWVHNSRDSSRAHSHVPRSQFESMHVYYREGEGKLMEKAGTFAKSYAFDEHVGRHNVFHIDKDDCHKKPYLTVQRYFSDKRSQGKNCSTFDYKPEALMRALIRDYTQPEHTVVDLCMRHGITAVAAKLERRSCIGIEIEKQSYALAVGRFKDQFGVTTLLRASPVVASPLPIAPTPATPATPATTVHLDDPLPDIAPLPEVQKTAAPLLATTPIKYFRKKHTRECGTPGCKLPDNHIGLCSCATVGKKRTRNAIDA